MSESETQRRYKEILHAVTAEDTSLVESLVRSGYDLNSVFPRKLSVLEFAVESRSSEMLNLLLRLGANPNQGTPLHRAIDAEMDHLRQYNPDNVENIQPSDSLVALLLHNGAEPNALLPSGETPLDVAIALRHWSAVQVLRRHGARRGGQPAGDDILKTCFGTVFPPLTECDHLLFEFGSQRFRNAMRCLGAQATLVGSRELSPGEDLMFSDHCQDSTMSQGWAIDEIDRLKLTPGFDLICDAELSESSYSALVAIDGRRGVFDDGKNNPETIIAWIERLIEPIEKWGWLYIRLPSITLFDLLLFTPELRKKVGIFATQYPTARIVWSEGKTYWPKEPDFLV